jgi:integrase
MKKDPLSVDDPAWASKIDEQITAAHAREIRARNRAAGGQHPHAFLNKAKTFWYGRYYEKRCGDGSRRRPMLHVGRFRDFPTQARADAELQRLIDAKVPSRIEVGATLPFARLTELYQRQQIALRAKGTRRVVRSIVDNHLLPAFGQHFVHLVDTRAVCAFIGTQLDVDTNRNSLRLRLRILKAMLNFACRLGLATATLDRKALRIPASREVAPELSTKAYTEADMADFIKTASPEDRPMFALAAHLGLRAGEVLGMGWPAIDFERKTLRICQQSVSGEIAKCKTAASAATLPLPAALADILADYRDHHWVANPHGLLFVNPMTGKPYFYSTLARRAEKHAAALGIKYLGLHGFRRGCGFALARAGASLPAAMRVLRHTDSRITALYFGSTEPDRIEALEAASRRITRAASTSKPARSDAATNSSGVSDLAKTGES